MAKEVDDDVPIYFSPGEDGADEDLAVEPDRKALLEDAPPTSWERYSPAKTLEQAAKEAEVRGEQKFKRMKNRSSASIPPEDSRKKKEDSIEDAAVLEAVAGRGEQSMTLERFLKLSGKFLKPNVIKVDEASDLEPAAALEPRQGGPRARKQVRVLLLVACVNVFAIGFWCGSFLFPNNKVVTGLRIAESQDASLTSAGPRLRGDSSVADVVARVNPVVVNIDTRYRRDSASSVVQPLQSSQRFFQPPAGSAPNPRNYAGQSQGSGLIVSTSGHILTSNHVVPPGTEIRVTLSDQREYQGSVVGRDAYSDLAVIKIGASGLPVARFADVKKVRVGDWAIVIGSPHGFDHTVTIGLVSALGRIVSDFNHHIPLIQTDATIAPGNSGGPLVNIDGEVIGVAVAAANKGTVGINFALPADTVSQVAKKLIEEGSIPRPFLGIYMEDIDPDKKKAHTLQSHPVMVVVNGVVPRGPAEKVGITRGDILIRVNGKPVRASSEVRAVLSQLKPGDSMDFDIRRLGAAGQELKKRVILEKYPDDY